MDGSLRRHLERICERLEKFEGFDSVLNIDWPTVIGMSKDPASNYSNVSQQSCL